MEGVESVQINEITPRDGLQNIEGFIPTEAKIRLVDMLVDAGAAFIESTAFVSPKWVPQLADAAHLLSHTALHRHVRNSVLIPNQKGFELARDHGAGEIVFVLSASEVHNRSNVHKSVEESLDEAASIAASAAKSGIVPRANLATAFGYRPEEIISAERVVEIVTTLDRAGYAGVTLCDTTGVAGPNQVHDLCAKVLAELEKTTVAVHFHQCGGIEFANTYAALTAGVRVFESAVGGLGGCPFADNPDGNIATERLVAMFARMGIECGIDQAAIDAAAAYACSLQQQYSAGPGESTLNRREQ